MFLGVVVKSVFGGVGLKSRKVWRTHELRGIESHCVPDFCAVVEKESNLSQKCPVGGHDSVDFFCNRGERAKCVAKMSGR